MDHYFDFDTFSFSASELRRLMRRHGVTIRDLAARMQISQAAVRRYLKGGATGHVACELFEWITGSLSPRMRACYRMAAKTELTIGEIEDFEAVAAFRWVRKLSRQRSC